MRGALALLLVALAVPAQAGKLATPTNHAPWRWRTLETERFSIHYPRAGDGDGAAAAARRIADRADEIWLREADVLGWFPVERLDVVVVDDTDDLRAWAWPLRGTIVISASTGLELSRTRGLGDGLIEVFAHELAHVMTHKRAAATSERLAFGGEVGAQLATGGVGGSVSLPIDPVLPQWWSEGGAEYLASRAGFGAWTPERDAGLRAAALGGRLLDWAELQVERDKGDVGSGELAYQQGFAFFRWLAEVFGDDLYARLLAEAAARTRLDPLGALEAVTREDPRALHDRFVAELTARARAEDDTRRAAGLVEGAELWPWGTDWSPTDLDAADAWARQRARDRDRLRERTGSANLFPRWSADGRWLGEARSGWVRVRRSDEGAWAALSDRPIDSRAVGAARTRDQALDLWIPARFGSAFAFVPGRDAVIVAVPRPLRGPDLDGEAHHALALVDLRPDPAEGRRPARLDHLKRRIAPIPGTDRGFDPAVSPDGSTLAFVRPFEGRPQLVVAGLDGHGARVLLDLPGGSAISAPSFAPDGRRIAIAVHHGHRADLWTVAVGDGAVTRLTDDGRAERTPWWAPDGIWFTAEADGVTDVFRLDPTSGAVTRATRVAVAAATPSITPAGNLLYAARTAWGWKSMAVRRDAVIGAPADGFVTLPGGPAPRVALAEARTSRRYDAFRSLLPIAAAPELRVIAEPDDAGLLGGGWLETRDAAEQFELFARGLVGQDVIASGAITARVTGPDLTLWGGWEDDARRVPQDGAPAPRDDRVTVGTVGLSAEWDVAPDAIALLADWSLARTGWWNAAVSDRALPFSRTARGGVGVALGDPAWRDRLGVPGGDLVVIGSRGASTPLWDDGSGGWTDDGEVLRHVGWWRAEVAGGGAVELGRLVWDARGSFGWTDRNVPAVDELRAGGDLPDPVRTGFVEGSVPLSGFAPRALGGERLAVAGIGALLPIRNLRVGGGPLYLDDLGVRGSADLGSAWGPGQSPPVVADVAAEIRLAAVLSGARWDSVARVARGFGEPSPADDPTDPVRSDASWRFTVGIGTGW